MPETNKYGRIVFPFEELVQTSSIIYYQRKTGVNFPILYLSPNIKQVLGYGTEVFVSDNEVWLEKVHPEDRDKVIECYSDIKERGKTVIEYRFKHNEGHYIWVKDEVKLLNESQNDSSASLIGTLVEITDKKKAEVKFRELNRTLEKRIKEHTSKLATANRKLKKQVRYKNKAENLLKEQHKKLRLQQLAIDNLNDMVVVTKAPKDDPLNSKIIFVNKAFENFTGYRSENVKGRKPTFLHGPKTSEEVLARINKKIVGHEPLRVEFINYKKDGTTYWTELDMAPFPAREEGFMYWVGINRDITQRKKAEQKLEKSEQRYRAFAELSFDAIFEIDRNGIILNCNKRALELFGYDREELVGMGIRELTPKEYREVIPEIITDTRSTGNEAWERVYMKKDGTRVPTEIHTQFFEIGGEQRLIAYVRDNTTHKNYENAIQKSLKEKETLLAEVHHRVKNNLAIISGLLEMQVFNTEDKQVLDKLKESQSRIQSIAMVHEKLYSSDSFSEVAIDQYINDLLNMIVGSMIDSEKSVGIEKEMDSITLSVSQAIPCGLLLNELITNCYKHAFTEQKKGTITISLHKDENNVILSVRDNGCGLPEDFKLDTQSSLGMTLITTLTKQLGGNLEVFTENGSCFRVVFEVK